MADIGIMEGRKESIGEIVGGSDGSPASKDGSIILSDGTMVRSDGIMVRSDGMMVRSDGIMMAGNSNNVVRSLSYDTDI